MTTTFIRLGTALAAAFAGALLMAGPAAATPDTDCRDYPTRAAAQAAFDAHGGSATYNWHGLDNDHDGLVCEHHRFPGQPTPPPNPGPSPTASPEPTPSESPAPSQTPGGGGGPSEPAEPTEPVPSLPITGTSTTVISLVGAALLALGGVALYTTRRRRET